VSFEYGESSGILRQNRTSHGEKLKQFAGGLQEIMETSAAMTASALGVPGSSPSAPML